MLEWFPFPSSVKLLEPEMEPGTSASQANSVLSELSGKPQILVFRYENIEELG